MAGAPVFKIPKGAASREAAAALADLPGARTRKIAYARFSYAIENAAGKASVTCYDKEGKTVIDGGSQAVITAALAALAGALKPYGIIVPGPRPERTAAAGATGSAKEAPAGAGLPAGFDFPYLGGDESGKGDYFGPLAVAVVVLGEREQAALVKEGLVESKAANSLSQVARLAERIKDLSGGGWELRLLAPADYNALLAEHNARAENLNHMLCALYVELSERLMSDSGARHAVIDRFGKDGGIVGPLTDADPRRRVITQTKAERYPAVAAASIIARQACLDWFERTNARLGFDLPRGASNPSIVEIARDIVQSLGEPALGAFAKLHFKTTKAVLAG